MFYFGPTNHVVRIELLHVEPPVWRQIRVPSDLSLPVFARAIETAMGWLSYHLHSFEVGGIVFGMADEETDYLIDERTVTVKQILPSEGSELVYAYDFGDDWHHRVVVEAITERTDPYATTPIAILDGQQACPPEDCGGSFGYDELRAVLADPTHEEYSSMRQWAGKKFDPTIFDPIATQRALTKLMPPKRLPKSTAKQPLTLRSVPPRPE